MRYYDWPEAHELAVFAVLGRHHCGIADCCGPLSPEEEALVEELTAELAGSGPEPKPLELDNG